MTQNKLNLNNITFIFVEPNSPSNIGSICRACKNMGIKNIVLVKPKRGITKDTYILGWGAKDTIDSLQIVDTLDEVLKDKNVIIGTTNRKRKKQFPLFSPKEIINILEDISPANKTAFIFGRENNGLFNDEIIKCNYFSKIPIKHTYPSINLAQAAMIYAYELFQASSTKTPPYNWRLAKHEDLENLYKKIESLTSKLPITLEQGPKPFTNLFRRIFGRTIMEKRDIKLVQKFLNAVDKSLIDR